jgi:CBS domain-containing protein
MVNDTVVKAARLMRFTDFSYVPVIENERTQKLVGIVTDRDLAMGIVAEGLNPKTTNVEDVMTHGVVTCRGDDNLQEVLDVMAEYQLCRLPVVDSNNKIIGIIAQADLEM